MPEVAVSLGANIDRESNIRAAVSGLIAFYPGALFSPVFESKAVGFEGPDFFNLAGIFYSDLEAASNSLVAYTISCHSVGFIENL